MADPRTFVLIGDFQDNITPALESINKTINSFKQNMASMATKKGGGYGDVTQSVGKLVSAQKHLKEAIEGVGAAAKSATQDLKDYKSMLGKVSSAHYHIQKSGTSAGKAQSKFWQSAEKDLDDYKRKLEALQRQTKINPYRSMPSPDRGRGGGGRITPPSLGSTPPGGPPRPPRGGGGGGMSAHMAEFGFAYTLGSAISQPIQNAIVSGFQIGIGMMTKPFQYFVSNFGERMQDELSDLKAAGGFFSISREQKERGEKGFVNTFRDAVAFTQENNRIMDKMAATLPGVTEDYVEVSKRISDSVARLVTNDSQKAAVYAESIRKAEPQYFKDMRQPITSMKGEAQQKASIQAILANLTKNTVLAGQGGRAGAGGARGAYGLPQLTERMLSQDQVSMGEFQRYAAIFSDPMIMSALEKEIPNINKSAKSTVERAKAIDALFKRVLPPELIEAYRRTTSGIAEGFRTALVGKETGLFGLGRPLEILVNEFDEFGNVLKDGANNIKQKRLGLYDFIRDMAANLGQVFQPIAENITLMYDPLTEIGKKLVKAREFTYKLLESFNFYLGGFKKLGFEGSEANLRASLTAIADLLRYVGAINITEFSDIVNKLKSKDVDFGAMMSGMLDKLLNSKAAFEVGKTVGDVVGTVITEVSKATGFISGRLKSSNQLFEGLKKGFDAAGGVEAFKNIFKDVFGALLKVLWDIFKPGGLMPLEGYMLIGAMVVLPAAVQGLGMLIAEKVLAGLTGVSDKVGTLLENMFVKAKADIASRLKGGFSVTGKAKEVAKEIAAETSRRKVFVTGGGEGAKGAPVTESGGKGTSGRYARSTRQGNVTVSGRGITTSEDAVKGGAKITQGRQYKTFMEMALGADDSIFGRPLLDFSKKAIPALKSALSKLVAAFGSLTPVLSGMGTFFGTVQKGFGKLLEWARGDVSLLSGLGLNKTGADLAGKVKGLASLMQDFIWTLGDSITSFTKRAGGSFTSGFKKFDSLILDWIEGSFSIRTELAALLTSFKNAFTGLKNVLFDWIEGSFSIRTELGGALKNFGQRFQNFFTKAGNLLAAPARGGLNLGGAAGGAKGIGVRILGVAKNVASAAKGGLGGFLGGAKNLLGKGAKGLMAGPGKMKDFFGKGMKGLGKVGGIATAGVGIIEAIMSLLSGDSLGTALGKGAGPVLGTIIGTALLGPLGGIIGGMVGSLEGITQPLGKAFDSIVNSFAPLASVVGTFFGVIGDVGKMIASLFGAGTDSGFSGLAMVLEPIVKLFQLLEIGIRGLAVALKYVRMIITEWTGSEEEKLKARREFYDEDKILKERQGQLFAQENRSIADNEKERARMFAEFNEKAKGKMTDADSAYYQSFLKFNKLKLEEQYKTIIEQKTADAKLKGLSEERRKALQEEVNQYKAKLAALKGEKTTTQATSDKDKPTTKPPAQPYSKPIYSTPGKPGFLTLDGKTFWRGTDGTLTTVVGGIAPKATPAKPKSDSDRIRDDLRSRAGADLGSAWKAVTTKEDVQNAKNTTDLNKKATDQIKKATDIKTSTDKTTQAVNNLATKITPQTNLQTSVAAIYSLLASGQLRVVGSVGQKPNNTFTPTPGQTAYPGLTLPAPDNSIPGVKSWQNILGVPEAKGALGDAIASEMKNKPSGSDLVIANSSETVIPAAGGYGMLEFVDTLKWGFASMLGAFKQAQQKQDTLLGSINQTLKTNQQQTNARLMAMEKKFATPGMAGGLGGAAAGGVDAFTPIAQKYGLQMTSGYRPGDPGWHGANRARDFSNGTGPTPQMMQFAQYMASTYGANLKELIYTPLGFSIKNGQQVPPYAQGSHYNHVHVAYANGLGNPIVTPTKELAQKIDAQALGKANVKTYTAGKGEFGGETNVTTNITINQQPGQDADELASIVAMKISEAVSDARAASIFV